MNDVDYAPNISLFGSSLSGPDCLSALNTADIPADIVAVEGVRVF